MPEFGAEKGLLLGQARRTGGSCSKAPNSLMVFRGRVVIGKMWSEGFRVCDFLLIGWCSRDLLFSLKLPLSNWMGALVPAKEVKDIVMYTIFLEEEPRPFPKVALLFLFHKCLLKNFIYLFYLLSCVVV